MYIIVVGVGRVGLHLAKALIAVGHEVTAIERDASRYQYIADEIGSVAIQGDGASLDDLKAGGANRADLVIAVTGSDETNLAVCQMAKGVFSALRTMSLVKSPSNDALFRVLGVDTTINTTHLMLSNIEEEVPSQPLVHLLDLQRHSMDIVALSIPQDASVVGKLLTEVSMPPSRFVTLVVKDDGPFLPHDDLVLNAGDEVVVVTVADEEQALLEALTGVD